MGYFAQLFQAKKDVVRFSWTVNRLGEISITVTNADGTCAEMVVFDGDTKGLANWLNRMLSGTKHVNVVATYRMKIWEFGVLTAEELVEKLNSAKCSKAKTLWNGIPREVRPVHIEFSQCLQKYVVANE